MARNLPIKVGDSKMMTCGLVATIVSIFPMNGEASRRIVVEFENGDTKTDYYSNYIKGNIKSVYAKSVYGVGFLGCGKYKPRDEDYSINHIYRVWKDMLRRCYDIKELERHPTYKGCTVCEEWHNFQNFAKWYDENYYEVSGEIMNLDKDIICDNLMLDRKVYSPNTCLLVPKTINLIFVKPRNSNLPMGVTIDKKYGYINATITYKNKTVLLGRFNSIEEASKCYKLKKEEYIKSTADEYKNVIPAKLYNELYKYTWRW